jgi:predicted nucleic acid-binding protein
MSAIQLVRDWLASEMTWTPVPGPGFASTFLDLVTKYQLRGNLVTDAQLAALALEHGLAVYSADTDFARFTEVTWVNPVAP